MILSDSFADAAREYRFLLDRGYPETASVKLVGDRRRLDAAYRIVLKRGILSAERSVFVQAKLAASVPPGSRIFVDGYNVLFTIVNYLRGHPVFVSTDGLARDGGGAHGRIPDRPQFEKAALDLCLYLLELKPARVAIFLDAPVPRSAELSSFLRARLEWLGMEAETCVVPSADPFVAKAADGFASSSDSIVAARSRSPVFDLARRFLERRYEASLPDLRSLFLENATPPNPDTTAM